LMPKRRTNMLILGVDLETGGAFSLPHEENFITEFGAVLWDTELKAPVKIMSHIFNFGRGSDPEASEYNGISPELIEKYGIKGEKLTAALHEFAEMYAMSDFILAHSGRAFDRPIILNTFKTENIPLPEKEWLDSREDIEFPRNCKAVSLTYLQCFHGFAYPGHRAIFDIMAMFRVFNQYPFEQILTWARSPIVTLRAMTKNINWKNPAEVAAFNIQKDKIKKAGFKWNPETKLWTKELKEVIFEKEKDGYDFPYKIITPETPPNHANGTNSTVCEQAQHPVA